MSDEPLDTRDAVVVVLLRDDRVLVIRRASKVIFPGYWTPPSGRVRVGEMQEATVVREVREEVGLQATPIRSVWECETEDGQFHLHWWLAQAGPGDWSLDDVEVSDARWIRPIEFAELTPTFADDRWFFEQILPEHMPRRSRGG
jgi:8-oxo-dGTP pyrophosphatase MutT (NUDIX family)